VTLLAGSQTRRLCRGVGWSFGTYSLPTHGTYVEFRNTFHPRPRPVTFSQSLSTGRPPAFNRAYIDCKFPREEDVPTTLEPGDSSSGKVFHTFCFTFADTWISKLLGISLRVRRPGRNHRTHTHCHIASLFSHQRAGPQNSRNSTPTTSDGGVMWRTRCRSPIPPSFRLHVVAHDREHSERR
jgi:hypothetical protein